MFFQRPISAALLVLAVAMLASSGLRRGLGRRFWDVIDSGQRKGEGLR